MVECENSSCEGNEKFKLLIYLHFRQPGLESVTGSSGYAQVYIASAKPNVDASPRTNVYAPHHFPAREYKVRAHLEACHTSKNFHIFSHMIVTIVFLRHRLSPAALLYTAGFQL